MNATAYLTGHYDYRLVVLSIAMAIAAAYAAIDMVGRIRAAERWHGYYWLTAGTLAMGTGIWSMHFIGMLAFKLPIAMGYDIGLTALSWGMAVVGCGIGLRLASRSELTPRTLMAGGSFMAAAILGMHYTGMYAMQIQPGIVYDPAWVIGSIIVAFVASCAGVWMAFSVRETHRLGTIATKTGAAVLKGGAIAGAHYTAMAGSQFPVDSVSSAATSLDSNWLAVLVAISSILLLGTSWMASALDRRLESRTALLVESLRQANEQLRHTTRHDPLTDLANRRLLTECLDEADARWQQSSHGFAVVYMDIDGFKLLNDNLGHDVGDQALQDVATGLTEAVRCDDVVARVGGDEFVILLRDITSAHTIETIVEDLLQAVQTLRTANTQLSVSIGSAQCPDHGENGSGLMAAADQAMFNAKKAGKNRHARFQSHMAMQTADAFAIRRELSDAIEHGQIVIHYQPKYSVRERDIIGAEALVRWQHPQKGLIPPNQFVPVAERCGAIDALETCVLRSVCAQIRAWLDAGIDAPRIAINLSAIRIRDPELPRRVQACLQEAQVDADFLMFEVTETLAIQEMDHAVDILERFSAMGITVALDDFGTGHCSLSYLHQLPVQQLKMDRAFLSDLDRHNDSQIAIIKSIITLAHALNLHVVAEGVESEEQLISLERLECDQAQGFFFSQAIPAENFAAILTADAEPRQNAPDAAPSTWQATT